MQFKNNPHFISLNFYFGSIQESSLSSSSTLSPTDQKPCLYLHLKEDNFEKIKAIFASLKIAVDDCSDHIDPKNLNFVRFTNLDAIVKVIDLICQNQWLSEADCEALLHFRRTLATKENVSILNHNDFFELLQVVPGDNEEQHSIRFYLHDRQKKKEIEEYFTKLFTSLPFQFFNFGDASLELNAEDNLLPLNYMTSINFTGRSVQPILKHAFDYGWIKFKDKKTIYSMLSISISEVLTDSPSLKQASEEKQNSPQIEIREEKKLAIAEEIHQQAAFQAIEMENIQLLQVLLGANISQAEETNRQDALGKIARTFPLEIHDKFKANIKTAQVYLLNSSQKQQQTQQLLSALMRCIEDAREITFLNYVEIFSQAGGAHISDERGRHYTTSLDEFEKWLRRYLDDLNSEEKNSLVGEVNRNPQSADFMEHLKLRIESVMSSFATLQESGATIKNNCLDPVENGIIEKLNKHDALVGLVLKNPRLLPQCYQQVDLNKLKNDLSEFSVSPDLLNYANESLLFHALLKRNFLAARLLISRGADIDLKLNEDKTACELAKVDRAVLADIQKSTLEVSTLDSRFQKGVTKILDEYEKTLSEREERYQSSFFWRIIYDEDILKERRTSVMGYRSALHKSKSTYDDRYLFESIKHNSPPERNTRGMLSRSELHDSVNEQALQFSASENNNYGITPQNVLELIVANKELRVVCEKYLKEREYWKKLAEQRENTIVTLKSDIKNLEAKIRDNSQEQDRKIAELTAKFEEFMKNQDRGAKQDQSESNRSGKH